MSSAGTPAPPAAAKPTAPSGASYAQRALDVTIQLGKGSFGTGGFNTVKLSGHRVTAAIEVLGMPGMGGASISIYGMTPDTMNQLSTLGVPREVARLNNIAVEAGDVGGAMSLVYQGNILDAWQDLDGAPETFMTISSRASSWVAMRPTPPSSFPGPIDVATVMAGMAARTVPQRKFENNGVQVKLPSSYFHGTALQQAHACARAANIGFMDDGTTWAIWPLTGSRGGAVPLISPASGLVGYPKFMPGAQMRFRCLFNPSIQMAGDITMQSSIPGANGPWHVDSLTYNLAAQMPDGPWFCDVQCSRALGVPVSPR